MSVLTWLHISDLHFCEAHDYDASVVLNALLQDVADRVRHGGLCPDFVAVTGDIAFSGKPGEYVLARRFLDKLLSSTGLGLERLFLVPGNHDVDRTKITRGARAIGDSLRDRGSTNAVLTAPDDRRLLMDRFCGYAAFVRDYLGQRPAFDHEHYFYVSQFEAAGATIVVLGLNSAWLCSSDDDKAKGLLIGERQARAALELAHSTDGTLKIALLHHPLDWLREFDQDDSGAMLMDQCDFILHGHLHRTAAAQLTSPDGAATILAGGACYETREFPNMVNWVRLDLATGSGTVYLRRYSDARGGFWAKDTLTYRNVPDGEYRFRLGRFGSSEPPHGGLESSEHKPTIDSSQTANADHGGAAAAGKGAAVVGDGNITITGDVQGGITIIQDSHTPRGSSSLVPPAHSPYDLAAVRDLLCSTFSAADLRRFFLYAESRDLRQFTQELSPSDGLASMVDKVIEFCSHRDLIPELLVEVERINPRQFARYAGRLRRRD